MPKLNKSHIGRRVLVQWDNPGILEALLIDIDTDDKGRVRSNSDVKVFNFSDGTINRTVASRIVKIGPRLEIPEHNYFAT